MVGRIGCTAIGKLLKNSGCSILSLSLQANLLDDECINILVGALIKNSTLKSLDVSTQQLVTLNGWCAFSSYLSSPTCSLAKLYMYKNHLNDTVLIFLGKSLTTNKTVTGLYIGDNDEVTTSPGWQGLSTCLSFPKSVLHELALCQCNINNDGSVTIVAALVENLSLKTLNMAGISSITPVGWIECFNLLLASSKSSLEDINLKHRRCRGCFVGTDSGQSKHIIISQSVAELFHYHNWLA